VDNGMSTESAESALVQLAGGGGQHDARDPGSERGARRENGSRHWPRTGSGGFQVDWGRADPEDRLRDEHILIIDDCTLDRENLAAVFTLNGMAAPSVAWDLPSLVDALDEGEPSVVLLNLATRDSALLLRAAMDISPRVRVIVLGASEDDETEIVACAEAGAAGYHMRADSLEDLLALIRKVAAGETSCSPAVSAILLRRLSALASQRQPAAKELALTTREAQILRMLELGRSNQDIAVELSIAVHTVKNHVHSLLTKLGVSTRAEAAALSRTIRSHRR
jgi:DNA-binding NarL/FixJ family response regulator